MQPAPNVDVSVSQCAMTAKLKEGGSSVKDKSQTDKSSGDGKKSDAASTTCQCACHKRDNTSAATTAAKSLVVDLTASPCQEKPLPPPPAAEHCKFLW